MGLGGGGRMNLEPGLILAKVDCPECGRPTHIKTNKRGRPYMICNGHADGSGIGCNMRHDVFNASNRAAFEQAFAQNERECVDLTGKGFNPFRAVDTMPLMDWGREPEIDTETDPEGSQNNDLPPVDQPENNEVENGGDYGTVGLFF